MGFFSWDCKECDHPLLSPYSTNSINGWMNSAVVIESNGSILKGDYDGYGRIDIQDIGWEDGEPCCYHEACWEKAGKPTEYKPSTPSSDQGFFFDEGAHNMEAPL